MNEQKVLDSFSYSKKYRILKSLFSLEAVGKLKPESQDFFNYMLLPPSFLYLKGASTNVIEFLEEKYKKNHAGKFKSSFSQLILKDEKGLLIYLLKYHMKNYAKLFLDEKLVRKVLGKNMSKVSLIKNVERRKIGIIDGNLAFEFVNIISKDTNDYIGYLATKNKKTQENPRHIAAIEEELKGF